MPKLNDPVRLNLQLFNGDTTKHVRAFLYDSEGDLVTTRTLPHVGNGYYANSTQKMPNTSQLSAVYRVYDDSEFSTQSLLHGDALDVFNLDGLSFSYDSLVILDGVIEETVNLAVSEID